MDRPSSPATSIVDHCSPSLASETSRTIVWHVWLRQFGYSRYFSAHHAASPHQLSPVSGECSHDDRAALACKPSCYWTRTTLLPAERRNTMSNVKRLALAIVQFLAEQKQYGNMSPDAQESLEVAVQCLETAFELSPDDVASLSVSKSLLDMFQETFGGETVGCGTAHDGIFPHLIFLKPGSCCWSNSWSKGCCGEAEEWWQQPDEVGAVLRSLGVLLKVSVVLKT